jgi:DME family drug/metabolite transporter
MNKRLEVSFGPMFVLAGAILWGTSGTTQALAPEGAQPQIMGMMRMAIGGLAFLALSIRQGEMRRGEGLPLLTTFLAAASMAVYNLSFFASMVKTGVVIGSIVTVGSAPIVAGILGWLQWGERPGWRWLTATAFAVVGCALLTFSSGELRIDPFGVMLALLAGVSYATSALFIKELLQRRSPDAVMAVVFCLGSLLVSPLLLMADLSWLVQPRGVAVVLHLGLVVSGAGYWFFTRGLTVVPAPIAVTICLAEPLTAGILGVCVLGERLAPQGMLGIGLLVCGLVLMVSRPKSSKIAHSGHHQSTQVYRPRSSGKSMPRA